MAEAQEVTRRQIKKFIVEPYFNNAPKGRSPQDVLAAVRNLNFQTGNALEAAFEKIKSSVGNDDPKAVIRGQAGAIRNALAEVHGKEDAKAARGMLNSLLEDIERWAPLPRALG